MFVLRLNHTSYNYCIMMTVDNQTSVSNKDAQPLSHFLLVVISEAAFIMVSLLCIKNSNFYSEKTKLHTDKDVDV